jgi:hypothetical protein
MLRVQGQLEGGLRDCAIDSLNITEKAAIPA